MTRKDAHKSEAIESFKIGNHIELDSQLWLVIDSKRGEISRDQFITKILSHALGLTQIKFGGQL